MLTRLEKEGFTQILSKLSRGEVDALKDTVTKKQIVTHGKDEAIDAIVTFSGTALELLKRRKVKRDVLFQYLAESKVPVNPAAEKNQLIRKILVLWGSHFNEAEIEETVNVESVVNTRVLFHSNRQEVARPTDLPAEGSVVELSYSERYHRSVSYSSNAVLSNQTNRSMNIDHSVNTGQTVTPHSSSTRSENSKKSLTAQILREDDRDSQRGKRSVSQSRNTAQTVTAYTSQTRSTASKNIITAQSSSAEGGNSHRDKRSLSQANPQTATAYTSRTRSTASENIVTAQSSCAGGRNSRRGISNGCRSTNTVQTVTVHSPQTRSAASESTITANSALVGNHNNRRDNGSHRSSRDTELPFSDGTALENVIPRQHTRDRSPLDEGSNQTEWRGEGRSILHTTNTVHLATQTTSLVTGQNAAENTVTHQSQPDKNFELGKEFVKWYYKILNSHNPSLQKTPDGEFGPQHFWSDCRLEMNSVVQGEVNAEKFEGSGIVANRFLALVKEEHLLFNPNIDMDGVKVKTEPHGLVLVLTCGTLHRVNECLGVFEQLFGLISDPAMDNNWRVKMSKLTMKSSQHPTMPKLGNGEQMLAIGSS